MPSIQLKTEALAPIPSVRQRIARKEKPGLRRSMRNPKRRSWKKFSMKFTLRISRHSSLTLFYSAQRLYAAGIFQGHSPRSKSAETFENCGDSRRIIACTGATGNGVEMGNEHNGAGVCRAGGGP